MKKGGAECTAKFKGNEYLLTQLHLRFCDVGVRKASQSNTFTYCKKKPAREAKRVKFKREGINDPEIYLADAC